MVPFLKNPNHQGGIVPYANPAGEASGVTWKYNDQIVIQDTGRPPKDFVDFEVRGGFPDLKNMTLTGFFKSKNGIPFNLNLDCTIRKDNHLFLDDEAGRFNCADQVYRDATVYGLRETTAPVCAKGDGKYFVRVKWSMASQGSTPSGVQEVQSQRWTCSDGRAHFG